MSDERGISTWERVVIQADKNRDVLDLPDLSRVLWVDPARSDIGVSEPKGPTTVTYETYSGEEKEYIYPGPLTDLTYGFITSQMAED